MADGNYPHYQDVLAERRGTRLHLTFNRPAARNALTHDMMRQIGDVLERARDDASVHALVLRGAGGNFSAGGDLNAMQDMPPEPTDGSPDPLIAEYRYFGNVLLAMDRMPKPVIALVEGGAAGGGFGMACCADVTILLADAKFALPEPRVGFIPSQIIPFISRRIGSGQLRRIAVLGQRVSGREAFRLGVGHYLADTVAEAEAQLAAVLADVDACDPAAVSAVKDVVLSTDHLADEDVFDHAASHLVRLLRRPEAPAGMRAFLNKQTPPWAADAQRLNSTDGGD
ncbi:MAG: enoyl-CoA hydratase/isomerase family protein [Minwuia sp.]|nr:enoyl-CoA hydratase/isomerase family protein [Minwuia sp.]